MFHKFTWHRLVGTPEKVIIRNGLLTPTPTDIRWKTWDSLECVCRMMQHIAICDDDDLLPLLGLSMRINPAHWINHT